MPKTEACELLKDYKNNPFMNVIISNLKKSYPGVLHECPYNVIIFNLIYFLFIDNNNE